MLFPLLEYSSRGIRLGTPFAMRGLNTTESNIALSERKNYCTRLRLYMEGTLYRSSAKTKVTPAMPTTRPLRVIAITMMICCRQWKLTWKSHFPLDFHSPCLILSRWRNRRIIHLTSVMSVMNQKANEFFTPTKVQWIHLVEQKYLTALFQTFHSQISFWDS